MTFMAVVPSSHVGRGGRTSLKCPKRARLPYLQEGRDPRTPEEARLPTGPPIFFQSGPSPPRAAKPWAPAAGSVHSPPVLRRARSADFWSDIWHEIGQYYPMA